MAELMVRPKVTREEYRALPEGPPYFELIDGKLVEMTRVTEDHNELALLLAGWWRARIAAGLGGFLTWEPNLYLPGIEDVYHPDLVYCGPDKTRLRRKRGVFGTPDVICEVLSPSTERKDRVTKMEHYRQAGVPHVWLIDPDQPVMVEEYVLGADGRYVLNATATAPAEWEPAAFPGWRVPLAELDAAVGIPDDE